VSTNGHDNGTNGTAGTGSASSNGSGDTGKGSRGRVRYGNGGGADSLTPFEFALAGVTPPGADAISSLRVIDDMRSMVEGVDETPVVHPGLHDFLDSGGRLSLGRDRRRLRPEAAAPANGIHGRASGGAFIDITPTDMAQVDTAGSEPIDATPPMPAAPMATAAGLAEAEADVDPQTEPQLAAETEAEAEAESNTDEAGEHSGDRSIDVVQADLQSALRAGSPHAADDDPTEPDLDPTVGRPPSSMVEQMVTGPIAGRFSEPADPGLEIGVELDTTEAPAPLGASTDGLRDDVGRFGPTPGPQLAEVAGIGALHAVPSIDESPGDPDDVVAGPAADEAVAELLFGELDTAETLEPLPSDAEVVPIGMAAAAAPGLLDVSSSSSPPMVPTAPPAAIAAVSRRPGGTVLALLGAGAAAAVLVAGSLWWASSTSSSSTEADQSSGEVAASPSTTETDVAAGSLGGSAERSTGDDDEPAEFQGEEGTSSTLTVASGPSTTGSSANQTSTTRVGRSSTTTSAGGSTTLPGGATSASTVPVSTSRPSASTTTSGEPSTTRSTTTRPSSSTTRVVTTRPPVTQPITTTTVAPARPVYIGDRITVGSFNGPGLGNVEVGLYIDEDRDGFGDRRIQRQTTSGNGRYSFEPDPGCYEVRFTPPAGYEILPALSRQALCLESGGSNARIDAVAERLVVVAPPSACDVESDGVEVDEFNGNWADSYTFYSASGAVVARTRNLGPYDTDPGETDREWFGAENGFNHRAVVSVAAERNGQESAPRACRIL